MKVRSFFLVLVLGVFACGEPADSEAPGSMNSSESLPADELEEGAKGGADSLDLSEQELLEQAEQSGEAGAEELSGETADAAHVLGEPITLKLESFEVQPGTERQVCKVINLPTDTDIDVVRLESSMTGTSHHFILYEMTDDRALEPVSEDEAVVEDCDPAHEQLAGNAQYIFGAAEPERTLDLPPGVSFHFRAGTRMIVEHHVLNYTPDLIKGDVEVRLYPSAEPEKVEHHASIIWFANWGFYLPPNKKTSSRAHCTVPYDVELFGLTSHFHELGEHFKIEKWLPSADSELIYEDDDWAHPKYQEYSPTISLKEGEGLQWTCRWNNYREDPVGPGKKSTDEMCITFAAVYPTNQKSAPNIQCNTPFDMF